MVQLLIRAGLALGLLAGSAQAACFEHDFLKGYLEANPRNMRVEGLGVTQDKLGLVEVYVAADGHFVFTLTDTKKLSCTLAVGTDWMGTEGEKK